jgi:uncharacterized membrane protein YjjP (DUF1212 family)
MLAATMVMSFCAATLFFGGSWWDGLCALLYGAIAFGVVSMQNCRSMIFSFNSVLRGPSVKSIVVSPKSKPLFPLLLLLSFLRSLFVIQMEIFVYMGSCLLA